MDDYYLVLATLLGFGVFCLVAYIGACRGSKDPEAFFDHETKYWFKSSYRGHPYSLIKEGIKTKVYLHHGEDTFFGKPLWVPLSQMFMGDPMGVSHSNSHLARTSYSGVAICT